MAIKLQYKMTHASVSNEAVFIGEMWVALANRELSELYKDVLSGDVRINGNDESLEVLWAGYMLSTRDIGEQVNRARVDKRMWQYPAQFNPSGKFPVNGPDCRELTRSSAFLSLA